MKKRKLNSKNPKYLNNNQLEKPRVVKSVKGRTVTTNSSGNIVGETTVKGIWYE